MKPLLLVPLLLVLIFTPAFGQFLSDRTGFVNRLDIESGGHSFEVESVSNYDVTNYKFDKDEKKLTLFISSGLENNFGELIIPRQLLSGNFTFYLNDQEYFPKIRSNDRISFVTLNFTGSGNNKIDIYATTVLSQMEEKIPEPIVEESEKDSKETTNGGGCLIATATFDSELAPQVQKLREIRDSKLLQTESGTGFMESFNTFYYSFSPIIADYERENPVFKEVVKVAITPMLSTLSLMDYADSEDEVLSVGISLIMLNIGMYVGLPVFGIIIARKRF